MTDNKENMSLSLDDLDSASGGAGEGGEQPKYSLGGSCHVPGQYFDGRGGLTKRTFTIIAVERWVNGFEYTLRDQNQSSYVLTGVPEDRIIAC